MDLPPSPHHPLNPIHRSQHGIQNSRRLPYLRQNCLHHRRWLWYVSLPPSFRNHLNFPIGIGLALSALAHSRGAKVLIGDLKLTPEAQKLVDSAPHEIKFQKCDVISFAVLKELISVSVREFGDVPDVVAPVAGIFERK